MFTWDNFINQIFENIDDNGRRNIKPISENDKKNILPLSKTDSLILWDRYFPEKAKYALLFERTYGDEDEVPIFFENKVNPHKRREILNSLNNVDTQILIYWNNRVAVKTSWEILVRWWDNFFYYPEDALIYVNENNIYFYNDMILKKLKGNSEKETQESVFMYLERLKDEGEKNLMQINSLFDGIPDDSRGEVYYLLYLICNNIKTIGNDEIRNDYIKYCREFAWSNAVDIILTEKPYNNKSLMAVKENLNTHKKISDKPSDERYYDIIRKIIELKSEK